MLYRTTQEDLKGLAVNLGGVVYPISADGVIDVPDEVGQKLATIDGWVPVSSTTVTLMADPGVDTEPVETEVTQADTEEEPPDPSLSMTKKELIALAELYEIDTKYLNKQGLVDAITKVMYPDGKE